MKKKLLATMAVVPLLGAFGTTEVLAATTKSVDHTKDATHNTPVKDEVEVLMTHGSTFTVVIPKEITLEQKDTSRTYTESYEVVVTGDISGTQTITVKPTESSNTTNNQEANKTNVEMEQTGKPSLMAVVEQTVTTATYNEINTTDGKKLPGTITVDNVTAGSWKGTFDFNISLN